MRLTGIDVSNVMKLKRVSIAVSKSILLVCGKNGMGKSSLAETFLQTMLGVVTRGNDSKTGLLELVHDGEKTGSATFTFQGGEATLILPKNKHSVEMDDLTNKQMRVIQEALPFVLNPERFPAVSDDIRRTYLYGLLSVEISPGTAAKRLLAKGHAKDKVEVVAPLVRASFSDAAEEASNQAREAKAAWKILAGSAWGSEKAKDWAAEVPQFDADAITDAQARVDQATAAYGEANVTLGSLREKASAAKDAATQRATLAESAARVPAITTKLAVDQAQLDEWETKVTETREKATGVKAIEPIDCPHCKGLLEFKSGELIAYIAPDQIADEEAKTNLPVYEKALAQSERAVANDKRDLAEATNAASALAATAVVEAPKQSDLDEAQVRVDTIVSDGRTARSELEAAIALKNAAESAADKTATAKQHHENITAWLAIAEDLSPSGIPAELISDSLAPFNERLARSASLTTWKVPKIENDASITINGRRHHMESKSHKWRTNAMLAEAIAHFSGAKLLTLDEYDILDPDARADLIEWLHALAESGEIDSAIVLGTATGLPSGLPPETFQTEWIQDGVIGALAA